MKEKCRSNKFLRNSLGLLLAAVSWLIISNQVVAAEPLNEPLDSGNPVYFYGDSIEYKGKTIALDDKAIYIDGSLSDAVCRKYDYVYNDFVTAYKDGAITSGTAKKPMNVYLAPYVYWIDDPDDPEVREGINGDKVPYGLWMDCSYLSLNGLTDNPENVVFAVNRGQNAGAIGNFTMFFINGAGTHTENLTMGNYCCVDLNYPLKPELSREKRQTAITQSQLILTNGTKITAKNCNFISRLNSCPFVGGTKILFEDCHFECTDDSLPTSAVYVNCDFDFYSSKPFYNTTGTGSVLLGCTFNVKHTSNQYLTKAGGIVAIIDGTFNCEKKGQYIGWTPDPSTSLRCYGGNITVNYVYTDEAGEKKQETITGYQMDSEQPYDNVDITGKAAMDAYRVEYNNQVIYNVYNLLKGGDDYDPLNQKEILERASKEAGRDYTALPTVLSCNPSTSTVVHGNSVKVTISSKGFTNTEDTVNGKIIWIMEDSLKDYITLKDNGNGSCTLTCKNEGFTIPEGMIYAKEESGLCSGIYVKAAPKTQPAPEFLTRPTMSLPISGAINISYTLSNEELLSDYSDIKWYRCSDAEGKECALISVSPENKPLKTYTLSYGDIGYYIKAVITPKQLCTYAGKEVTVISEKKIESSDVIASPFTFSTDFSDFGYERQPQIIPGFWTRDVYRAWLTEEKETFAEGWIYGLGAVGYGSENLYGLITIDRGARLLYTPPKGTYGDMNLTLIVNPEKNAGQGFGSAKQYMDIYIKFDTTTLTGYALRLERISNLDCGVQAALVAYDKENVTYISDKVTTSAYNSECTITLSVKDGVLSTKITTTHEQSEKQINAGLQHSVELSAPITENTYGGMGILSTGTAPVGNRAMFNSLSVNWDESEAKLEEPVPVKLGEEDPYEESGKTKLKKGATFTSGKVKFKVINNATNGKGTVLVTGITKKNLTSVKLVNTVSYKGVKYKVTGIGKNTFAKCSKMKKITIAAMGLKTVQKNALKGIHKNCTIKVPKKQYKKYTTLLKNKGQSSTVKIVK